MLNDFFVSVSADIPPLDLNLLNILRSQLSDNVEDCFIVSEFSVFNALKKLKLRKASCDELLNNRLLVSLADILAAPVCSLLNASIAQGTVPSQWKVVRVSPILFYFILFYLFKIFRDTYYK